MSAVSIQTSCAIGVVGAGAMGAGIAQIAAVAGHNVKLLDSREGVALKAIEGIRVQLSKLASKGKMTSESAQAAGDRLTAVTSIEELSSTKLVIEAIVENLEAKQRLFSDLEALVSEDCILASNTSSISVTAIGSELRIPGRLAGLHFFNPAPLMSLVEVVSGLATTPQVANTLFATAKSWGKTPVHTKSTPGFIVNRVARPYYAEALRLVQEGAADFATIDTVMRETGGFRMGPFELMDMIGNDVNFAVTKSVWSAFYHDQRFLPSLIQQELVDAGFLGIKSGRGFYDYKGNTSSAAPSTENARELMEPLCIFGDSIAAQAIAARLTKAGIHFDRRNLMDGRIATAGKAVIYVTDGRSATLRAMDSGIENTVLIDLALDYANTSRIAITAARQCQPDACDSAIALLQAAGLSVSRLADIPGMAVMRTVAMLANEAADTVNQGVCSVIAVDAAMMLGVNYPCGPLAWADQIGVTNIREVLLNLGNFYGEDRYRISPLIHSAVFANRTLHD